jgi:hypothetical protein
VHQKAERAGAVVVVTSMIEDDEEHVVQRGHQKNGHQNACRHPEREGPAVQTPRPGADLLNVENSL